MIPFVLIACLASDSWADAEASEPGPQRGALVLALLVSEPDELSQSQLVLANEAGLRASGDCDLELALGICESLHTRAKAPWSAFNLALVHQRAGNVALADGLLAELLLGASPSEAPALWSQRGILAWGAGLEQTGLGHQGRGLALGHGDSAAILAREALARHNLVSARIGFRTALARNPEHPWALRGWGLSTLPSHVPLSGNQD